MSYCLEEVFEMACRTEREGAEYYSHAVCRVPEGKPRSILRELAEWECRHEDIFRRMLEGLPEEQRVEYYDPEGEAAAYVDLLVAGKVFKTSDADAMPETVSGILSLAIDKEKDSILFYLGVKEAMVEGTDPVDQIIAEELRHVRILSELLSEELGRGGAPE